MKRVLFLTLVLAALMAVCIQHLANSLAVQVHNRLEQIDGPEAEWPGCPSRVALERLERAATENGAGFIAAPCRPIVRDDIHRFREVAGYALVTLYSGDQLWTSLGAVK